MAGVLRVTAIVAVVATSLGVVIAPGLHGNASEATVVLWDRIARVASTFMFVLLSGVAIHGAYVLARAPRLPLAPKTVILLGTFVSLVLATPALQHRLPALFAVVLAMAANVTGIVAGICALRTPVTRGAGLVVVLMSLSATATLFGWELAVLAGERASIPLYGVSRGFATAAVAFETFALMSASVWVSSRSRLTGQIPASLALGVAFIATWAVAKGKPSEAKLWEWILITSLGDHVAVPHPFYIGSLATLLACASLTIALVVALQPRQMVGVVGPLALAIVARGETAVPLRALAVVAAALWLSVTVADANPRYVLTADNLRPNPPDAPKPVPSAA